MTRVLLPVLVALAASAQAPANPPAADPRPAGAAAATARPFSKLFQPAPEETFRTLVAETSAPPVVRVGLPNPAKHPEAFARLSRTLGVEWIDGYPYAKEPLAVPAETLAALNELFTSGRAFSPGALGDSCSTFHPEIRIEWTSGTRTAAAAIGLGCQEILARTDAETFRRYIPPAAYGPLDRLLAPLLPTD